MMWRTVALTLLMMVAVVGGDLVVVSRHLRRDFLATHNFYRREVKAANMRRLEWDEVLESAATKRALTCSSSGPKQPNYGENVYVSRHLGHYRGLVAIALQSWANEGYNYTPRAYSLGNSARNFTQLTWAASQRVGCSINKFYNIDNQDKTVQDFSLLVCLYDPKGNVPLEFPYQISGRKCSNCPGGTHCVKGLCVDGFVSDGPPSFARLMKPTFEERPTSFLQPFSSVCSNNEKWVCECRAKFAELRTASGELTEIEKKLLLEAHNTYRARANLPRLVWDVGLEVWAKYVVRCEPLYPGPRDCFTNFGKGVGGAPITVVVDDWAADNQAIKSHEPFCRTPADSSVCNRNTNIMQAPITMMACEAMSCGDKRQLTCIYKASTQSK